MSLKSLHKTHWDLSIPVFSVEVVQCSMNNNLWSHVCHLSPSAQLNSQKVFTFLCGLINILLISSSQRWWIWVWFLCWASEERNLCYEEFGNRENTERLEKACLPNGFGPPGKLGGGWPDPWTLLSSVAQENQEQLSSEQPQALCACSVAEMQRTWMAGTKVKQECPQDVTRLSGDWLLHLHLSTGGEGTQCPVK